jgi:DNA polymerase IIIc chi subunit
MDSAHADILRRHIKAVTSAQQREMRQNFQGSLWRRRNIQTAPHSFTDHKTVAATHCSLRKLVVIHSKNRLAY